MANQRIAIEPVFHALGDPTRRAVVQRLARGTATVGELAAPFDMALPSFLKHITVLETSGVIRTRKVGRVRTCELRPAALSAAERWMAQQRSMWEARTDRLAAYAETLLRQEQSRDE
ncbi:MAG: helix-turn-helix transcriptional regulator [Gemmatimonadaceae bacterium]|nr:helix-turn-helix transcriptional regulator [Gemmatimonadaceae bacterium]